ncbi:DUF5995 family protein [Algibacter sp. L4_22]|uniref:DUF5995 family protein n=1 Tax=Algibacter sp. L4_22 TaxID=2942477 RepID=UPI00201B7ED9|nr:DUF5995 family protein [Algibacter sp. L4_22]MCL5129907.1 DUF5995 family protein [Algibacter sp. L4_22]
MIATTIDEVIEHLEFIIQTSIKEESTLGYFAALYQKVTLTVKNKLGTNYFDDDVRMEKLDVIFANRYLMAYSNYKQNQPVSKSWQSTFDTSFTWPPIVLQHLLLGMNAHINLDLGIAAAEISNPSTISSLQSDFNKINDILSALINDVLADLSEIWPTLLKILKFTNKVDDFLINFSMNMARDGAWKFAITMVNQPDILSKNNAILKRDGEIAEFSKTITNHKFTIKMILLAARIGERGSVSDKIRILR